MPKIYENGHQNVLDIWFDLISKVKYSTILIFKVTQDVFRAASEPVRSMSFFIFKVLQDVFQVASELVCEMSF